MSHLANKKDFNQTLARPLPFLQREGFSGCSFLREICAHGSSALFEASLVPHTCCFLSRPAGGDSTTPTRKAMETREGGDATNIAN